MMRMGGGVLALAVVLVALSGCEHKTRKYGSRTTPVDKNAPAPEPTTEASPRWEDGTGSTCQTVCGVDTTSTLSGEDTRGVANSVDGLLRESASCLKRVGAYKIEPAVLVRFGADGQPLHVRFDVGGYEDLNCMHEIERKLPRLHVSHSANVRCDYRCAN